MMEPTATSYTLDLEHRLQILYKGTKPEDFTRRMDDVVTADWGGYQSKDEAPEATTYKLTDDYTLIVYHYRSGDVLTKIVEIVV